MVKKDQYEVFLWNGLELLVKIFTRDPLCEGISLGVKWMVQPKTDRGARKNDRKNVLKIFQGNIDIKGTRGHRGEGMEGPSATVTHSE